MALATGEASSSSAASRRSYTYHVFLSFRGPDSRNGFAGHLWAALDNKGIITFRDDNDLEPGDEIKQTLLKAIEESMFAITILSPNYASSAWCLDELQHIVECSNNIGLEVMPLFYDVEPSDVRYQKGSFETHFEKHHKRMILEQSDPICLENNKLRIKGWRDALKQIAGYSGWDSKNQHEARLVESIAEHIHRKLIPKLPPCTKNLVGTASRMEEVIRLIGTGVNEVRFIGIWGMGGIGKTTIARTVYDALQCEFRVSCFVRNVRELSGDMNGLINLQKNILSCLNIKSNILDVEDGQKIIKTSLCNKKVLLVLDDVTEVMQLENLAGEQDWFGPGSRIIITTRNKHVLNMHRVHAIYKVKGLDRKDAYRLFCLKAFQQNEPSEEYSHLSREVVKYTRRLPLAVVVLGSYLYGRQPSFWEDTVAELRRGGIHSDIVKILRISVDHLLPKEKGIFLDIACFFKGEKKDKVIHILNMCNFHGGIGGGIDTLIDKCLVTLDQDDKLEMHDLLQETGKKIVLEESLTNNPGERSRLWSKNDIDEVLRNDLGTDAIQSIALSTVHCYHYSQTWEAPVETNREAWSSKAFSKTRQLKLLRLYGIFPIDHLPTSLKVLHWEGCHLEALPLADQLCQVVEIKLQYNVITQLWHGRKLLFMLKYLDLTRSFNLEETPDVSGLPILETLILRGCAKLIKVHPSLTDHKKLVLLNLAECYRLKTLPGELKMSSLKELILSNSKRFKSLPKFGKCMKQLSSLSLDGTAIRKLPASVGYLVGLQCLNVSGNPLATLPITIHQLTKLTSLFLNECPKLQSLPGLPSSLREFEASQCDSLDMTELVHLSKSCNIDASSGEDYFGTILIPYKFLYFGQVEGNCVSFPPRPAGRCSRTFSWILEIFSSCACHEVYLNLYRNGEKHFMTRKISPEMGPGGYLYGISLSDRFIGEIEEGDIFELSIEGDCAPTCGKVTSSSADWNGLPVDIKISDAEDLKESEDVPVDHYPPELYIHEMEC